MRQLTWPQAIVGSLLLAVTALAACKSSASPEMPTRGNGIVTTSTSTTAATSRPPATGAPASTPIRSFSFEYTRPDGWHYHGVLDPPTVALDLRVDVSVSPPGQARLVTQLAGKRPPQYSFFDDNPGRSRGPMLDVSPGGLVVPTAGDTSLIGENNNGVIGPCEGISSETFAHAIQCTFTANYAGTGETGDISQEVANAVVRGRNTPLFEFNFAAGDGWDPLQTTGAVGYDSSFYVGRDGTVTYERTYTDSLCGRVAITPSG